MIRVLKEPQIDSFIVHPAMVYSSEGGVFSFFMDAMREGKPVEIVES